MSGHESGLYPLAGRNGPSITKYRSFAVRLVRWQTFLTYHHGVGARTIHKSDHSARQRKETLTLWTILAAIGFPLFLAYILVAVDMRSDLSELKPVVQAGEAGAVPVGWSDLEGQPVESLPEGKVRMIGYMMDGYEPSKDGTLASMFILLPEAGQFLHPAHRIPNQMVEIRPRLPIPFHGRELVWAMGTLNRTLHGTSGSSGGEKAAWAMGDAKVDPAEQRNIGKWFRP
jgi:hypothetical protein